MKTIFSAICLSFFISSAYSETLATNSVVCWSEDILKKYIVADEKKKKNMEEHECLVWEKEMKAKHFLTKSISISEKPYSISNIELRYKYYGERVDNVWTFSENLSK